MGFIIFHSFFEGRGGGGGWGLVHVVPNSA